jgi:hypothetical protein
MTKGPNGPEYIPSKEERRQNREKARGASAGSGGLSPTTGGDALAAEVPSRTEAMPTEARGRNGVVAFDGHFVTINRKGFLARASIGKGEKRIPLGSISAVQLKPAGPMMNGFIQFTVPGGNERRSKFGHQTFDATKDENSVMFTKAQMPQFLALRGEIEQAIVARSSPNTGAAPNLADQIQQLASLRDQGILTDEEFDAKKADLLSRM